MRRFHRLARVALRPAAQVPHHLRHEELEALPLAALRPLGHLDIGVERRVVHPRVHQAVGQLGEAEDAAAAAVQRARVAVHALLRRDERPRRRLVDAWPSRGLVSLRLRLDLEHALPARSKDAVVAGGLWNLRMGGSADEQFAAKRPGPPPESRRQPRAAEPACDGHRVAGEAAGWRRHLDAAALLTEAEPLQLLPAPGLLRGRRVAKVHRACRRGDVNAGQSLSE